MTTPDTAPHPAHTPERGPAISDFTLEDVEAYRAKQSEALDNKLEELTSSDLTEDETNVKLQEFYASFDGDFTKNWLTEQGIPESHPRHQQFAELLRQFSIDKIPREEESNEWTAGLPERDTENEVILNDDGTPKVSRTGRDRVRMAFAEIAESEAAAERRRPIEDLETEVAELRDARNEAYAARMRAHGFLRVRDKDELHNKFVNAEWRYTNKLRELEMAQTALEQAEGISNENIIKGVKERAEARFKEDEDAKLEQMIETTRFGESLNKFAKMGRLKKLGIVALAGGGTALTLGLGGFFIGGAGAAAAIGLAGGGAFSRVGRSYAVRISRLYNNKTSGKYPGFDIPTTLTPEQAAHAAANFHNEQSHKEVKNGDRLKRGAVIGAMGAAALPFGLQWAPELWGGIANRIDPNGVLDEKSKDVLTSNINDGTAGASAGETAGGDRPIVHAESNSSSGTGISGESGPTTTGLQELYGNGGATGGTGLAENQHNSLYNPNEYEGHRPSGEADGYKPNEHMNQTEAVDTGVASDNGNEVGAASGAEAGAEKQTGLTYHEAALTIERGEGWFQTMKELGITSNHWEAVLSEAGPKLEGLCYSDGTQIAYYDPSAREYRINMSPDGRMPQRALDVLTSVNSRHHWELAR